MFWLTAAMSKHSQPPPHLDPQIWEERLRPESAFDGAEPDPQGSFSLSPAKFPGCSSAVRLPSPQHLGAPSTAGNGPDNCSSRAGDFSVCICKDPTHTSFPKLQLIFSSDLLSTYYKPSSVLHGVGKEWGEQGGHVVI